MAYTGNVVSGGESDVRDLDTVVIRKASVSSMDNNAYLLSDKATGAQLLIDAAADAERLHRLVQEGSPDGRLDVIVTTHNHWDHHRALRDIRDATSARTAAGRDDVGGLPVPTDQELDDDDTVEFGNQRLRAIHLVGHTPGSTALLYEDAGGAPHLFTGDSLFPGGVGKTGSPKDFASLIDDIEHKVFDRLPEETWVYPGHGADTTLGAERPHLAEWRERGW